MTGQNGTQNGAAPGEEEKGSVPDIMRAKPVATLPPQMQQGIELTRQHTIAAGEIAAMQWGEKMTPLMRRAITSYCERWGIDANTELDVLGGSFYINSEFYLRKLGELRRAGVIADFWFEHIHNDPRLKAMMENTLLPQAIRDEATRRWSDAMFKRAEQNAPEGASAICICYITLPSGGHPIKGCKWAGAGTSVRQPRSGGSSAPNPIAESNAELSVESQSARRAARQIISHVSDVTIPNFDQMENELTELSSRLAPALERAEAGNREIEATHHETRALPLPTMDAYASAARDGDPVAIFRANAEVPLSMEQIQQVSRIESPYDEEKPSAAPAAAAPAPTPATSSLVRVVCHECGADVVVGDPSTHRGTCSRYAD